MGMDIVIQSETGDYRHPLYGAWYSMMHRCYRPQNQHYRLYGGDGVTVDPAWHRFRNFASDMGQKPSKAHSLDRIDRRKPYGPQNCRWATKADQTRNRRCTRLDPETAASIRAELQRLLPPKLPLGGQCKWSKFRIGPTMREIATRHGVSFSAVRNIRQRGDWS